MRKPTKAAFDQPAPWQHHKAFLSGIAADPMVAHAMEVGPFAATIGGEATIEDGQPQARPVRATDIKRRERVALLHRSRNGVDRQPDAISINQGHTLAPNHQLRRVIATRAAHGDALDRLRVDDCQCWRRTTSRRAPPPHGNLAHQAVEQAKPQPASEPAIHRPPRRQVRRQGPPWAADTQMPGNRPHNRQRGRRRRTARWISPFQPTGHLLLGKLRYHILQAWLVPRPVLLRPHPVSPPYPADLVFNYRE